MAMRCVILNDAKFIFVCTEFDTSTLSSDAYGISVKQLRLMLFSHIFNQHWLHSVMLTLRWSIFFLVFVAVSPLCFAVFTPSCIWSSLPLYTSHCISLFVPCASHLCHLFVLSPMRTVLCLLLLPVYLPCWLILKTHTTYCLYHPVYWLPVGGSQWVWVTVRE